MTEETSNPLPGLLYKTDAQIAAEAGIPQIPASDSKFFNISVRAWLVILLTLAVIYQSVIMDRAVVEPLYGAFLLGIGFYLGQKKA